MKCRVGEKYITNEGYNIEIVEYINSNNCTVQFKDGSRLYNRAFGDIKRGEVKNPNNKVGEKYKTLEGYTIEIIKVQGWGNCTILFDTGLILYNKNYGAIKKGNVKNPFHPSVFGVGYLGNCPDIFPLNKNKNYTAWKHMIERGYSSKKKLKTPSYKEVTVHKDWHCFSNFNDWCNVNRKFYTKDWHLDKDILVKGNKIYSPETCCFVPDEINLLFVKNDINRGELPIGVHKGRNKFKAVCSTYNQVNRLGTFNTPLEAFQAYKTFKESHIKKLANKWCGQITKRCYEALMNYKVEIED